MDGPTGSGAPATAPLAARRIVVGIDGSLGSEHALRWALREALPTGDEVEVLLVWSDVWALGQPETLWAAGKEGIAKLKEELAGLVTRALDAEPASAGVRVIERIVAGQPEVRLVEESEHARLLVVGSSGLSGLRRWFVGSVSQQCAQHAHVPVVIIPPPTHEELMEDAALVHDRWTVREPRHESP